ncbi:lipocalin-like domain-containing protein [Nonomuraea sp. NPDC059007]|uniref:lipocalin-like domain-containing protein n=1 Tax=Nonomuraea sp. NPDC059007 TaxID=3346692 RepID=UPI0036B519EA
MRKKHIAVALCLTAVGLAGAVTPASAAPMTKVAQPDRGFPKFVRLPADQANHPSSPFEWWYVVGHVRAGDRRFGYEVTINRSSAGPEVHAAITDEKNGKHYSLVERFPLEEVSFSDSKLDVRTPKASLTGPMEAMTLKATLPDGRVELVLRHSGPALYPGGTGLIPFAEGQSYYYSLPSLKTSGHLTVKGTTHAVRGESWLDRQWGDWEWSKIKRWTWMAVHLGNGDRLNVWDLVGTRDEKAYATILHRDGRQTIAPMVPLAKNAGGHWRSPLTGQNYPTRWKVKIPGLRADLTVRSLVTDQELDIRYPGQPSGLYEADSAVTGTYAGRPVSGQAYVELYGDWSRQR